MPFLDLDIEAAARLCNLEKYGDWYRDPWGWPECNAEFASSLGPGDLGVVKDGKRYILGHEPAFHVFDVPKSYIGIRPAVIQDVQSRLAYAAAASALAPKLHSALPDWVFGWRVRDTALTKTADEWALYRASQSAISTSEHAAQTDVTSFFASVDIEDLVLQIVDIVGDGAPVDIIRRVLRAHNNLTTRRGLPQRSTASSILAQVAMRDVDDLLGSALDAGRITNARRWMDDISFEGPEAELYGLLVLLQEHGRHTGLEMNASKTKLLTGSESSEIFEKDAQRLIQVPIIDSGGGDYDDMFSTIFDADELLAAEAEVLANPTGQSRSFAGLVLRSLRHYDAYDRSSEWMAAAHHLPHAADNVGRYLSAAWRNDIWANLQFEDWFVESEASSWPHLDWVSAQHALVIPSSELTDGSNSILARWLAESSNLQKVAVAVHRLALSRPKDARVSIVSRLDSTSDPLLVRLLSLGYLVAGGSTKVVADALARHASNTITLKYLVSHSWQLPVVSPDFDPSADDVGE
ncbi:MAG TPA: RNA-directed DNA polymerase [Galbitalea sp.]|nr:RNA-directed DNA polymerase [Galbitalea sp.]